MTIYVYQLTSNVPLMAYSGIGNAPVVGAAHFGSGLVRRDVQQIAESNGAARGDGHRLVLELLERREEAQS